MFHAPSRLEGMDIMRFASLAQLSPLSHEQLAQIAPYASERVIPAGRRLLLGGPFAQELVLIAGGRGLVRCAGETVAELGPGDVFGELARERPVYDTASVTAQTDLRLIVVSARAIRELRCDAPETVAALVAACAQDPVARGAAHPGPRPALVLSLVRSAA
jgi:CRP/FNR family cyclic AMP-dependent transcriptional regulator